jgi:sulfur carrier protein
MLIQVNGKEREVAAPTLSALLHELGYGKAVIATALNACFVRAVDRTATPLKSGDAVEILVPRQGG